MTRKELSPYIIEGLIGIGYDIHIFDVAGEFPGGLDREAYEKERIAELLNASEQSNKLTPLQYEQGLIGQ